MKGAFFFFFFNDRISSNNLFGSIPDEILDISELIFLNLSQNHLMGKKP